MAHGALLQVSCKPRAAIIIISHHHANVVVCCVGFLFHCVMWQQARAALRAPFRWVNRGYNTVIFQRKTVIELLQLPIG